MTLQLDVLLVTKGHAYQREPFFEIHPKGSNLVGRTKQARQSPIAYLQFGHERSAYENATCRKLSAHAVKWAGSPEAHTFS